MFGYHDNDRCAFDLWSPIDDPNGCAVENRAFSPYVKHSQEVEDVIQMILQNAAAGNYQMSFELDDDFSDADVAYIQKEVQKRLGR